MTGNEVITPNEERFENDEKIPTWIWVVGVTMCVALVAMIILFLTRGPKVAEDDSWERVQAAGVLKVATSADYPPFSYTNRDFGIDGFDPALIRAIGDRLGVRVQITDYAFEGLGAALETGQADVAIAAISMSPERGTIVDFSNVYYVSKDGILARSNSGIEHISQVHQFAGLRVGVQRSSVYETWAQKFLVDDEIIKENMLFAYAKPEHAVNDLKLGRVDVVIMDLQPAINNLSDPEIKLVGEGMNLQMLSIAMPKGADSLKAEVDSALLTLQNEDRVIQLAQTYLGLRPEDVIPPPTPEPTDAPCVNAMQFVEDLNYDNHNFTNFPILDPGKAFQKGWRIKNTGTCDWTNTYFLKYAHGNNPGSQMGGQPTVIENVVKPGETYDMFVDLVAPKVAGRYIGYWQMHDTDGVAFGQTVGVAIEVRETAPGEPTPTVTIEVSETPPVEPTATDVPPTAEPTEEPGADLREGDWVLEEYRLEIDDDELIEVVEDTELNLNFEEEGKFDSFAGCNDIAGRYVTNNIQIIFRDFMGTKLICKEPDGVMEQEVLYHQWLERAEEYRINEDDELEFIMFVMEDNERVEKILLTFSDESLDK